jgi:hypothetical protein
MTHPQGNFKAKKATLYYRGGFGATIRQEVREVRVSRRPWAQYESAVICESLAPRKRKWNNTVHSYQPYLVVLEGWGHPDPASPWTNTQVGNGVITQQGRYSYCDERWDTDFDAELARYLEANPQVKVLGDYRHTQGCDTRDPQPAKEYHQHVASSVSRQLEEAGIPAEVAKATGDTWSRNGPYSAAGVLWNQNKTPCSVELRRGRYVLEFDGQSISVEAF